jgi:hypothetical protein
MFAGFLPMARQSIDEISRSPGGLDAFLDRFVAICAQLRSDDAPAIVVLRGIDVPDGVSHARYIRPLFDTPGNLERFCDPDARPGLFTVELDEPLSLPDLSDGLF